MHSETHAPQFDAASPVVVSVASDATSRALDNAATLDHHSPSDLTAALSLIGQVDCVVVDGAGVATADFDTGLADREPDNPALDAVEAVRRRSAHVPVVLVTNGESAVVREAFRRGVTAHVPQGYDDQFADALATRITTAVDHAHTERDRLQSQTAVETRETAVATVDADGRFATVDPAYRAFVAREESTLVGAPLSVAHPEGDAERLRAAAADTAPDEEWAGSVLAVRGETPIRLRVVLTPQPGADAGFALLATRATDPLVLGSPDGRR